MTHRRLTHLCVIASLAVATIAPLRAQETAVTASGFVEDRQGAHVIGAFVDSLKLVMFEHGIRIAFQEKTRSQLGGPFWLDYSRSVHIPDQWEDTDSWPVNYIGHPIHGAAAGYIWLDHDRNSSRVQPDSEVLGDARTGGGLGRRLQPAIRVRSAERSVDRQRRTESGDEWMG